MLRFHKFTIGSYWVSDYGCSDNEEQFNVMMKYDRKILFFKNKMILDFDFF
jgi:prolyl oligopeptidase PreP (S9A serine peptidase family)